MEKKATAYKRPTPDFPQAPQLAPEPKNATIPAMYITLSWDLFIIVFFAVIITYTFIIGKKEAVKVILASYISIVAVQGIGSLLQRFQLELEPVWATFGLVFGPQVVSVVKLVSFVALILFLAIRSGVTVVYNKQEHSLVDAGLTALFGFVTAGLLLSTLLTFVVGVPLLDMSIAQNPAISPILQESMLMQLMVMNQDLWFAFPAIVLVAVGFVSNRN